MIPSSIPLGTAQLTLLAVLLLPSLAVLGLWVRNYARTDSAPQATQRTSNRVIGFVVATLVSIAIAFSSVAGLAGAFGEVVSMFPGGTAQLILGGLAVAGFSGVLELSVVGATVIVVIVIFATAAVRNR
jgi:hypothetical protein